MVISERLLIAISRRHFVSNAIKHVRLTRRTVKNMTSSSFDAARQKLQKEGFSMCNIPNVLFMDNDGVYVNESAPHPEVVKALTSKNGPVVDKIVPMPKLRANHAGEWLVRLATIHSGYFGSRDEVDEALIPNCERVTDPYCVKADVISLRAALELMDVELSVNMDYYRQHTDEIDVDLGYHISNSLQWNDELAVRKLEEELFYKLMCKIVGKENADDQNGASGDETLYEKSFMIRDFRVLSSDGNFIRATAVRDEYYLVFFVEY